MKTGCNVYIWQWTTKLNNKHDILHNKLTWMEYSNNGRIKFYSQLYINKLKTELKYSRKCNLYTTI